MNYGIQNAMSGAVAYAPADVRADFIRKVYGLFFASLLVTVGIGAFCSQPTIAPVVLGMWPVLAIGGLICIIAMSFARRASGVNMLLLYLYAAIQGAIFGPLLTMISQRLPGIPVQAALLTVGVFGALTLYVMQSGKDFSSMNGMLFAALIGLLIAGLVLFFVHSSLLATFYSLAGVLIFSGFVLYDTSQILYRLAPGDEVAAAISIYLDFLLIFQFILNLLLSLNSSSRE